MSLLDHRILVNAPPDLVWEQLSNLQQLPKWLADCAQTSILTTNQRGVGVRLRNTMNNGPSIVQEIVSWYEGLGYEYVVVDGRPYQSNRGRIRVKATPEGTVIQWTFEYTLRGFMSGLRNKLSVRRRLEREIVESLQGLKHHIDAIGIRMDQADRDKAAMRPAPTARERAAMAAQLAEQQDEALGETVHHPPPPLPETPGTALPASPASIDVYEDDLPPVPVTEVPAVVFEDDLPSLPLGQEPPISDEDTKPRSPEMAVTQKSAVVDDAAFRPPESLTEEVETEPEREFPPDLATETHVAEFSAPPVSSTDMITETIPAAPPPDTSAFHPPVLQDMGIEPGESDFAADSDVETQLPEPTPSESPAIPTDDPVGPSIWEVFGVASPSHTTTQEPAIEEPQEVTAEVIEDFPIVVPGAPVDMPDFASGDSIAPVDSPEAPTGSELVEEDADIHPAVQSMLEHLASPMEPIPEQAEADSQTSEQPASPSSTIAEGLRQKLAQKRVSVRRRKR